MHSDIDMMYKHKERNADLFEINKVKEYFLENDHICEYEIKCEPSLGQMIGLSVRRGLMCLLEGVSIVALKINKLEHAFSAISGIKETVPEIILNLKKIIFKVHDKDANNIIINLKKNGNCFVFASDFEKKSDFVIINPSQYICTIDQDMQLNLSIMISKGFGYVTAIEHRFVPFLEEGFIAVDSVFSPLVNCGYEVSSNTSGRGEYDLVHLTVTTDGRISPDEGIEIIASKFAGIFSKLSGGNVNTINEMSVEEDKLSDLLETPIEQVDKLQVRTKNCLIEHKVFFVKDLIERTPQELKTLEGFGEVSLKDVLFFIGYHGLQLGKKITKRRKI